MMRRLRSLLLIALAAALGAVLGRVVLEARQRMDAGEPPQSVDLRRVTVRVQDVVPGLVAAMRVRDVPWSWLRIPSWFAAFAVNLGVAAVGGDLSRLREMVERTAMGMAGMQPWPSEPAGGTAWEPATWPAADVDGPPDEVPDAAPRWGSDIPPSDGSGRHPGGFTAFDH